VRRLSGVVSRRRAAVCSPRSTRRRGGQPVSVRRRYLPAIGKTGRVKWPARRLVETSPRAQTSKQARQGNPPSTPVPGPGERSVMIIRISQCPQCALQFRSRNETSHHMWQDHRPSPERTGERAQSTRRGARGEPPHTAATTRATPHGATKTGKTQPSGRSSPSPPLASTPEASASRTRASRLARSWPTLTVPVDAAGQAARARATRRRYPWRAVAAGLFVLALIVGGIALFVEAAHWPLTVVGVALAAGLLLIRQHALRHRRDPGYDR
jgi:hypothetical protein